MKEWNIDCKYNVNLGQSTSNGEGMVALGVLLAYLPDSNKIKRGTMDNQPLTSKRAHTSQKRCETRRWGWIDLNWLTCSILPSYTDTTFPCTCVRWWLYITYNYQYDCRTCSPKLVRYAQELPAATRIFILELKQKSNNRLNRSKMEHLWQEDVPTQ